MRRLLEMAWVAASTDLPLLILGESGTGKTLLARAIHNSSQRSAGPFVSFNAAVLSDTLLDSQLFGHERGAFTDANQRVRGKFEQADGGTLFIDEIADMSTAAQAKILRAVEYGEFERLGSETSRIANVRLISATHLSLEALGHANAFRRDLFFRLSGLSLTIPPLRQRPYDLPLLAAAEVEIAAAEAGKAIDGFSAAAAVQLFSHRWPGNLRELNRVIRAAVALSDSRVIEPRALLFATEPAPLPSEGAVTSTAPAEAPLPENRADWSLAEAEKRHILAVLDQLGGNKRQAALALNISRSTLDRKLKSYL